jgi:hypothetical protein
MRDMAAESSDWYHRRHFPPCLPSLLGLALWIFRLLENPSSFRVIEILQHRSYRHNPKYRTTSKVGRMGYLAERVSIQW